MKIGSNHKLLHHAIRAFGSLTPVIVPYEHPACICHLWIASEYGGREHPPQLGFQGRRSPADEQHSLDQRCIVSKAGLHELDNCLDKNSLLTRHFRAYIDRIGTRSAMKQKIKLARTGTQQPFPSRHHL